MEVVRYFDKWHESIDRRFLKVYKTHRNQLNYDTSDIAVHYLQGRGVYCQPNRDTHIDLEPKRRPDQISHKLTPMVDEWCR